MLDEHELLPGLLPENRAAKPTGRNVLAVFQGLSLTYTQAGPQLDRLTHTQRRVLDLLHINPPWPEQTTQRHTLMNCGKWGLGEECFAQLRLKVWQPGRLAAQSKGALPR